MIIKTAKGEGLNCTFSGSAREQEQIAKNSKSSGPNCDSRKLGILGLLPRAAVLFREIADLLFFAILAQLNDESRRDQNTKVVHKRSKIKPEVES